jgi:hypothetical protein
MGKIKKGWEIDTLSKSDMNTFDMCGEKYRRQKLNGERTTGSWAMIRGLATHKGIEVNSQVKIKTGHEEKLTVLTDVFMEEWKEKAKERKDMVKATGYDPDLIDAETKGKPAPKEADLQAQGLGYIKTFHEKAAPFLMPTGCEIPFTIPVDVNGKVLQVRGIIDWMGQEITSWENHELGKGVSILDFKTTEDRPKKGAWKSFELIVYAAAMQSITGSLPDQVGLMSIANMKTEQFVDLDAFRPTQVHVDRLNHRLGAIFKAIHAEAFHPASLMQGAWWCDKRFCGFWDTCQLRPE